MTPIRTVWWNFRDRDSLQAREEYTNADGIDLSSQGPYCHVGHALRSVAAVSRTLLASTVRHRDIERLVMVGFP